MPTVRKTHQDGHIQGARHLRGVQRESKYCERAIAATQNHSIEGKGQTLQGGFRHIWGHGLFQSGARGSGCNSRELCLEYDVANSYLHYNPQMFINVGMQLPKAMNYDRRCRLAHAFGEEYNIFEPYVCEGCQKQSVRMECMPQRQRQRTTGTGTLTIHSAMASHRSLYAPPTKYLCLHGELNVLAQTWYATITQNLTDKATVDAVNAVVCDE